MPNGWRRGGAVHRNGRTHYRHGTHIRPAHIATAGFVVLGMALGGTPLIAHPILLTTIVGGGAVVGGIWVWRKTGRRVGTPTHWVKGRVKRWAKAKVYAAAADHYQRRTGRPATARHAGAARAQVQHCHLCKGAIHEQAAVTRSGQAVWHTNCLHQLQGGHQPMPRRVRPAAGSPPPRARVEHCHLCKGAIHRAGRRHPLRQHDRRVAQPTACTNSKEATSTVVNEQTVSMADHELVWEYSGGTVTPRPECHAPVTADCRIEWVCGCETLIHLDRDEDGRPFHLTSHVWNNGFQEKQEKHYGKPGESATSSSGWRTTKT
jgi:hypothetical protein